MPRKRLLQGRRCDRFWNERFINTHAPPQLSYVPAASAAPMDNQRLLALFEEYRNSNPYVGSTTYEQFKEEMYGISCTKPPEVVAVMAETDAKTSGSPVQGVYKQNPGMPPASTGIPTSSKAAPMVASKCPYCHKHDGDDDGELETKDVFGKLKSVVVGGHGKKIAVQLEEMVKSLIAFKGQGRKLEEDRAAYFSDVRRALETEIMRKKPATQEQAQDLLARWGDRWNRLWSDFVVPSRQAYRNVRLSPGKGKKQFSSSDIASAVYALIDADMKDAAPNELDLAREMLSAMAETAKLTGEEGIDVLGGLFGGAASAPPPPTEYEQTMGKMFGTAMRAHLGGEKARMAASAFKKGAERAMMAAAAGGGDEMDLSSADSEPLSKNGRLAELIDSRSSSLKLAPEESYIMLLPDESVEPELLDKLDSMSPDEAANYVRAHAAPIESMKQEPDGVTRFVTMAGKAYELVQLGDEVPAIYDVDASGKRSDDRPAAQVGGPIHKSGGRLFFMFFRRQFIKPEEARTLMIASAAKGGGGSRSSSRSSHSSIHGGMSSPSALSMWAGGGGSSHSGAHSGLASHSHLSVFAKMAHDSNVDQTLANHTVFAPRNSAFTKPVPADRQRRVVESHIVKGRLERTSELNGRKHTLAGTEIVIDASRGTVNGIKYKLVKVHPNLVIYEIDSPLVK